MLEGPLYRTIRGYRAADAGVPKKRLPPALYLLLRLVRCLGSSRFVRISLPAGTLHLKEGALAIPFSARRPATLDYTARPYAHHLGGEKGHGVGDEQLSTLGPMYMSPVIRARR